MGTDTTTTLPDIQPVLVVDDPAAMDQLNQLLIVAEWPMAADNARATSRTLPVIILELGEN